MQLAQLELFVAVIDDGSMTEAGARLGMSQPAVSRSMRNFEQQLGVALFRKDGRSVVPTAAGDRAYDTLSPLIDSWRELQVDLRRLGGRPQEVTVAVPFGTARVLIPVLVRRAPQIVPDIAVNIVERSSPESLLAVRAGEYAMALVYPESPDTAAIAVADEVLCAVGRLDLLGDANSRIPLRELAQLPLLLSESTWSIRRTIDQAFASLGVLPRVVREVGIADALMAFAIEGDGVTILPRSNVVREHELGSLAVREIVEPSIPRTLALAPSAALPTAVRDELVELFRAALTETESAAGWSTRDE